MKTAMRASFGALSILFLLGCGGATCASLDFRATFDRDRTILKLAWERPSSEENPLLINIGQLSGNTLQLGSSSTSMYISGEGIQSGRLTPRVQSAGLAGRVIPFVVCLLPGAEYSLSVDAHSLLLPSSDKSLADVRDRPWTLTVSFTGKQAIVADSSGKFHPEDGIPQFGRKIETWIGTIKSVLHREPLGTR